MEMANPMMETTLLLTEMPYPTSETAYPIIEMAYPAIDLAYQEETMTNLDSDCLLLCYY